ncbi:MAG: ketol-acid reductoisomerase [Gammaproteobacteria bacterium]|jgi:ketol-acid reductoisomerase
MLYEKDTDPSLIGARRVAVLGFGAQGRAHALNLRDSGVEVVVGLRPGSATREAVRAEGLPVADVTEAVAASDVVMMLVPDEVQPDLYREELETVLKPGAALAFAHGFNIRYRRLVPRADVDVIMIAPLGIGDQVRDVYARGGGVPGLVAVAQDATGQARDIALSYAWANGHGRAGIMDTTFAEETETDLFSEQVILCGGVTHLIEAGFDTLVEAGYAPEIAYFCCLHELKLIVDLIHSRGVAGMRESISSTAEFGDYTRGPRIIDAGVREEMQRILDDIRSGRFADELAEEMAAGQPVIRRGREASRAHLLETVGRQLRSVMPWLKQ